MSSHLLDPSTPDEEDAAAAEGTLDPATTDLSEVAESVAGRGEPNLSDIGEPTPAADPRQGQDLGLEPRTAETAGE
ncbi:hypothetical protein [Pseudoclavibacter sp. RFBA6]|uniref:hypothetical protein n=1 Tax=Pseudoclavibacter sp. RFBA6 TaxID=2080573 RepID=UPI0015E221BD|nr:hypothetical protein [Pseudoclavibacter sp. RFBA6]